MKQLARTVHSRWRRLSRITRNVILGVIVFLVLARLAMPFAIESYVNHKLDKLPEYDGHIGDVDVHLFRGAYSIDDVKIVKQVGDVPEPFFAARHVDFSVDWSELRRGTIVSEFDAVDAHINFVNGPTEEQSQTKMDKSWVHTVEDLFPFRIDRFEVRNGSLKFKDTTKAFAADIFVTNMYFLATNIANARNVEGTFPAGVWITGKTIGGGALQADMRLNPFVLEPTFDVDLEIREMNLPDANDFLENMVGVDVKKGRMELFLEIVAEKGQFTGYVKPLIHDLDIVDLKQEKGVVDVVKESVVSFFAHIFKNWPKDQFGTKVPISGTFDNPKVGVWQAIVNALRNAIVKPLPPKVDETIEPTGRKDSKTVEGKK